METKAHFFKKFIKIFNKFIVGCESEATSRLDECSEQNCAAKKNYDLLHNIKNKHRRVFKKKHTKSTNHFSAHFNKGA